MQFAQSESDYVDPEDKKRIIQLSVTKLYVPLKVIHV